MARLIVKSPYIKSGGGAGGYMKYIATRDGVEKLQQAEIYASNIATRPGAKGRGKHGLFSDETDVDLAKAMDELSRYEGRVWTHIFSLRREDAARLGYDNANTWHNLLKTRRNEIAAAMKIRPNNFRWYAAFHNEGEHPHVHMMAWSADPAQGFLSKTGIRDIKAALTNDIFKQEMLFLNEQKSASRDELVRQARRAVAELARKLDTASCDCPEIERLIGQLARRLETVRGKKQYGYLPKAAKGLVDEIVSQLEQIPVVAECYDKWWRLSEQVRGYYTGEAREKPPLSQEKEFRSIKNAVIREAEHIRESTLEEVETPMYSGEVRKPHVTQAVARLLHQIGQIFQDNPIQGQGQPGLRIDSKRRRKLMEKKQALGMRQDFDMRME